MVGPSIETTEISQGDLWRVLRVGVGHLSGVVDTGDGTPPLAIVFELLIGDNDEGKLPPLMLDVETAAGLIAGLRVAARSCGMEGRLLADADQKIAAGRDFVAPAPILIDRDS